MEPRVFRREEFLTKIVRIDSGLGIQTSCWLYLILRKDKNPETRDNVSQVDSRQKQWNKLCQPPFRNRIVSLWYLILFWSESVKNRSQTNGHKRSFDSKWSLQNWSTGISMSDSVMWKITINNRRVMRFNTDYWCPVHLPMHIFAIYFQKYLSFIPK